jgi:hypothetical protein
LTHTRPHAATARRHVVKDGRLSRLARMQMSNAIIDAKSRIPPQKSSEKSVAKAAKAANVVGNPLKVP